MKPLHVLVIEREPLIANDMREEVLALCEGALVEHATTMSAADAIAERMSRIDLLIVSDRSGAVTDPAGFARLSEKARALLFVGEAEGGVTIHPSKSAHVARAPFTSSSLREDLGEVSVDGAPLFPRRSPVSRHSERPSSSAPES